jgi:hypothetical protein
MALTQVTVTGTVVDAIGDVIANARLRFTLSEPLIDSSSGVMVSAQPQTAVTDSVGHFSIVLYATNDAHTEPIGQVYKCQLLVSGAGVDGQFYPNNSFPTFYFQLPTSVAPTVKLSDLITGNTPTII